MAAQLWWLVHKDVVIEWRARQVGPAMLLMGGVVGFLFSMQAQGSADTLLGLIGSQYWLTVFLGGVVALDGSFASEREAGGRHGLKVYPIPPHTLFLAKLITNMLFLGLLQVALVLLFSALADVRYSGHLGRLLLLGSLGNLALASLGTLLAALAGGLPRGRGWFTVLMLPLEIPVVIAASEATRILLLDGSASQWWKWVQLLGAFGVIFTAAGMALFEFVMED